MKKIMSLLLVFGLVCLFSVKTATAGFPEAMEFFSSGNYVAAEKEFRTTLLTASAEDAPSIQRWIGVSLCAQKKFAEAVVELDKASAMVNTTPLIDSDVQLYGGMCLDALGNKTEAQERYKAVLLIKGANIANLIPALTRIDFVLMTQDDKDTFLTKAYYTVDGTEKDKNGKYIYTDYLSKLMFKMSAKAQANIAPVK